MYVTYELIQNSSQIVKSLTYSRTIQHTIHVLLCHSMSNPASYSLRVHVCMCTCDYYRYCSQSACDLHTRLQSPAKNHIADEQLLYKLHDIKCQMNTTSFADDYRWNTLITSVLQYSRSSYCLSYSTL